MDIYQTFKGKSIFFTGVTGFVGKVFLWKVLKEFDVDSLFVLIRTKKGQKPQDRLNKEVMTSPCFEPLKKQLGDAEWKRRAAKVIAVAGDMMEDRLGLSDADYDMVASKVHFIVHMAATVNFDERLDISVKMNVLGSLRVLALAQKAPKLEAYVHMSTCYVNYQRHDRQLVRETLYPLSFEPEDMCKFILAQDPAVIGLVTKRVLKEYGYPNTYTLTKSMGEHILERRKGDLPLTIIRPSIVGCAWREPMPGWVDALTAAGGLYLTAGLGVLREVYCKSSNIADLIPVDYVVNTTIKLLHRTAGYYNARKAAGAKGPQRGLKSAVIPTPAKGQGRLGALTVSDAAPTAQVGANSNAAVVASSGSSAGTADGVSPSTLPFVYQAASSSSLNLMRWETASIAVHSYWNSNPHPKRISKCDIHFCETEIEYRVRFMMRRIIPVKAMKLISTLPVVGSPERKNLVQRLEKAVFRSSDLQRQFSPFMNNQWCFDNTNTNGLDDYIKPEQVKAFSCDVYDINWHSYTIAYSYGMVRYIMKTDDGRSRPVTPPSGSEQYTKACL